MNKDGRGPQGKGPMTGRRRGPCGDFFRDDERHVGTETHPIDARGVGLGRGPRFGFVQGSGPRSGGGKGRGWGHGFGRGSRQGFGQGRGFGGGR